jgi:cell division protein FtsZ
VRRHAQAQSHSQPQSHSLEPNYQGLDKPTVQRKRAVGDGLGDGSFQEELLDIPAFLRRQAD